MCKRKVHETSHACATEISQLIQLENVMWLVTAWFVVHQSPFPTSVFVQILHLTEILSLAISFIGLSEIKVIDFEKFHTFSTLR